MRQLLYRLGSYLALFVPAATVCAQGTEQANDVVFHRVKELINSKKGDSLYSLLNDGFKEKFSRDKFIAIMNGNIYALGKITSSELIGYNDGLSSYKTAFSRDTLEFRISTDSSGKIKGLRFLPYKAPVSLKKVAPPSDNPMHSSTDSMVDVIARRYISKTNTVGLSIGIYKDGVTSMYGYGSTAKDSKQIPGPTSVFEIGSITKTFTATLLGYYVLEHKVSLSDRITKYLPDSVAANGNLSAITLQMLSNHTSGLPRLPDNLWSNGYDALDPYKKYTVEQMFSYLKTCKTLTEPGVTYAYSNLGVALLGKILERVSGHTYGQMAADIICKPLGMSSTFISPDAEQKSRQMSVYNDKGNEINMWDINVFAGAGAIRSTVQDMLRYAQANMQKDNTRLTAAIQLTHRITYDKEATIGLGWFMMPRTDTVYFHNGATGGCNSYISCVPAKGIAVVVLSDAAEDVDSTGEAILENLLR